MAIIATSDYENCGVYAIINRMNLKSYIGSSTRIRRRLSEHRGLLNKGKHPNRHLQSAWNKHGPDAFDMVVVENCKESELLFLEKTYIDLCNSACGSCGYNLSPNPVTGRQSDEGRKRISNARKGIAQRPRGFKMSEEQKKAIGEGNKRLWDMKGRKIKIPKPPLKGRKRPQRSQEWCRKISEAKKGRKWQ